MPSVVILPKPKWHNITLLEIPSGYLQITREFTLSLSPLSVGSASAIYLAFQSLTSISVRHKPYFLIFAVTIVTGLVVIYGR